MVFGSTPVFGFATGFRLASGLGFATRFGFPTRSGLATRFGFVYGFEFVTFITVSFLTATNWALYYCELPELPYNFPRSAKVA
jgi:hypothetical protein